MTPAKAKKRIADLRRQVTKHDELYYRQAQPEVTDFAYDALKRELADLEKQFPQFASSCSLLQTYKRQTHEDLIGLDSPASWQR